MHTTTQKASILSLLAGGAMLSIGCAPVFPRPFTAEQLSDVGTGAALAHYLSQPDANPAVCDRDSRGPHVGALRPDDFVDLTRGLVRGTIVPELFQRCAKVMFEHRPPAETRALLDAMGRAYRDLLRTPEIESDPARQAELEALHRVFLLRPVGTAASPDLMSYLVDDLREGLARGKLGMIAKRYGDDLLATLDLERGLWQGRPVTAATLDALEGQRDEGLLKRFAARLPDPALQVEARRRIVRLHIAASTWAEVKQHPREVEAAVLATGRNPVDPAQHAPVRGFLDRQRAQVRGVVARQEVWNQTVTLLAYSGDRPGLSVLPELSLRGALQIELQGESQPVTLCAPADALDVTPCVLPAAVRVRNPIAYLDADGAFRFAEHVSSHDAVALVHDQPGLALPVEVAGKTLLTIDWPMYFEKPADLVFSGPTGGRGPNLSVIVHRRDTQRLVFSVEDGPRRFIAAIENDDTAAFSIASRGGQGAPGGNGLDGHSGADGTSGSPASCPGSNGGNGGNGQDGGDGGPGGAGGPGGPGGDVRVQVECTTADCAKLTALLSHLIRSQGGPGGSGGSGGHGGRGGSGGPGGSGTSCTDANGNTTFLSSGSSGMSGRNGHDGFGGSPGADGPPGRVEIIGAR